MLYTFIYGESERDRSRTWVSFVTKTSEPITLYLAAGKLPFSQKRTLKADMYHDIKKMLLCAGYSCNKPYQFTRGLHVITIVIIKKNVWGTFEETLLLIEELRKQAISSITVFSSPSHLPRINSIWNELAPEIFVNKVASNAEMSSTLQSMETKKDTMNQLFFFTYKYLGAQGITILSFLKNLVLNQLLDVQKERRSTNK
jgi:hypothetical protein